MLVADNLKKRFAGRPALKGVSFEVREGEIFGLLGHNGAGKSTAVGIMLGMVYADSGSVTIGGADITRERKRALSQVGAIFEAPAFYDYLSGWRNLRLATSFSGWWDEAKARDAVALVSLSDRIDSHVSTYSHGMRQRLALAQALLPRPKILILDEPTDGLDPEGIHEFRGLVRRLRDEFGLTIMLNSHLLSEVEQTCDRVAILRKGAKVYDGAVRGISAEELALDVDCEPWDAAAGAAAKLGGTAHESGIVRLPLGSDPADLIKMMVESGARVRKVAPREENLEALYMRIAESDEDAPAKL